MDSSIVDAIASGVEIKPSEGGKYPGKNKSPSKIVIPPIHFDIKKTAIGMFFLFDFMSFTEYYCVRNQDVSILKGIRRSYIKIFFFLFLYFKKGSI